MRKSDEVLRTFARQEAVEQRFALSPIWHTRMYTDPGLDVES